MLRSLIIASVAAFALAAPTTITSLSSSKQDLTTTKYTATFDDLEPVADGLVSLQEVGPYDGLDYKGINLISLGLDGTVITGVKPRSSPNVGDYSARTALTEGDPYITTQYSGSTTDTFDFNDFYFGCVVATAEAVASAPTSCTVTVVGYKASVEVARQSFEFNVGLLAVTADMVQATLSNEFKGIDTATFETEATEDLEDAVVATLIDSLDYTTYNAEDKEDGRSR